MRCSRVIVSALLTAACGNVNSLALMAGPLITVHAHVDLPSIVPAANGAPLLGAVLWGVLPNIAPICYEQAADALVTADCPDVFGFFPGAVDTVVTIDPNGTGDFDVPLFHLPPASALIGADAYDQIAYATVIVVADTNNDGRITLLEAESDGGIAGLPADEAFQDTPLAASFVTLQQTQERLSFLQGSFTGLNLYYPAPTCATPPAGFSLLQTGPYSDASATCAFLGLDQTVEATPLSATDADALACRTHPVSSRVVQPKQDTLPAGFDLDGGTPGLVVHCIGSDILLLGVPSPETDCPTFVTLVLKGCSTDPACTTPTWDETASPPSWWPCGP